MPDRKDLVSTLWLSSSLAVLALVLVAPIWTSGSLTLSSRPDRLHRKFELPPGQSTTHLSPARDTDAALQMKALPFEDEEQEKDCADALDEPRDPFQIPCSFRMVFDRQVMAPRSILSRLHLRC